MVFCYSETAPDAGPAVRESAQARHRMSSPVSFTHLLNPFPARPGSEHAVASRVTWQSVRAAHAMAAAAGIAVEVRALILPGDEAAVEPPTASTVHLTRSVMDVAELTPRRPLPLIADLLTLGEQGCAGSHVIFSNMDIALQPNFYTSVHDLVTRQLGPQVPFTVGRLNVDRTLADGPMEALYAASGPLGLGYDCFVMPRGLIPKLDLGLCCIGAPHFDQLLYMELDALSGQRLRSIDDQRLTFHLGSDIAWAAMIDHVEFNLRESLGAIARMRKTLDIPPGSLFDRLDRHHFRRNATLTSALLRKVKRVPGLAELVLKVKRGLGRQF